MFDRFVGWYGKLWVDRYGDAHDQVVEMWRQDLEDMTLDAMRLGMEWCRDNAKWPPTLPEFREACSTGRRAQVEIPHWWESEQATTAQGYMLGVVARPGEGWQALRARIRAQLDGIGLGQAFPRLPAAGAMALQHVDDSGDGRE